MDPSPFMEALKAELERIGLSYNELPGLAFRSNESADTFLTHLRTLSVGADWHAVFPDFSVQLISPRDQSRQPYRPMGPWDHAHPPVAAVLHVGPSDGTIAVDPATLQLELERAGLKVYGVGRPNGLGPTHAFVVMGQSTSEKDFEDVVAWFDQHAQLDIYAIPRNPFVDDL